MPLPLLGLLVAKVATAKVATVVHQSATFKAAAGGSKIKASLMDHARDKIIDGLVNDDGSDKKK